MMKKFKIVMLMLFLTSFQAQASVSVSEAIAIYNKLVRVNYLMPPTVYLIDSPDINGWAGEEGIFITTADLKILSKAELALLIAHELAHMQFKDYAHNIKGTLQEDRADLYGSGYAHNIGYSYCAQSAFFLRLYRMYGNLGGKYDSHSTNLKRFWRLYSKCNRG